MKRFGTEYGGFYYPENLDGLDESSIIYCIGAGEDRQADREVFRVCEVRGGLRRSALPH